MLAAALVVGACSSSAADDAERVGPQPEPDPAVQGGSDASPADGGARDTSGGPTGQYEPGPPHVQLIGRFDTRDPNAPRCAWPGCRIVARFEGTYVAVRLSESWEAWMDGAPSEWDATVDGVTQKLVMSAGEHEYVLASSLPPGEHLVELYKRSEAQNGTTQFHGFDFRGGTLLSPPVRKTRRIEIIGDSQPAAFGVEGLDYPEHDCPGVDHGAQWQNFRKSFGARLEEILDAEVYGTVYSGKGIAKNIWHFDPETMPIVYWRALPVDKTSTWNPASFVPDVIVLMLGGNDFAIGKPVDTGPASLAEFTAAYRAFAGDLRAAYPQAKIIFAISPSVRDDEPAGRNSRTNVKEGVRVVTEERNAAGDRDISWFEPALAQKSELNACNGHGNPDFHLRVAQEIAAVIRQKTGW